MGIITKSSKTAARASSYRCMLLSCATVFALSACATPQEKWTSIPAATDDLMIVDCLLPPQVRQLGTKMVFLTARQAIKTSASECGIRGGEFVAFDRADAATSLKVWLPQAESGDPQAQTYVGEIFEKGLGIDADYQAAAQWYQKAADQDYSRAKINLGYLYESGLGVTQDLTKAMNLYRQASGIEDGTLEYVSTLEFAKRETARLNTVELRTQVSTLTEQLAESEARYRTVQEQLKSEQAALKDLAEKTESKRQEIATSYRNNQPNSSTPESIKTLVELDVIRDELDVEVTKNNNLRQQLYASRAEIVNLKSDLAAENEQNNVSDSVADALSEAEQSEKELKNQLAQRAKSLKVLQDRYSELEQQYQQDIDELQSNLDLSSTVQMRVALKLVDAEKVNESIESENEQLRDSLRIQNAEVAKREQEQQRLSAKIAALGLSKRTSQTEKRAAEAATRAANAELELARFEQSRLVTKLVEAQLNTTSPNAAEQLAILEKQLANQQSIVDNRQLQASAFEQNITEAQAQNTKVSAENVAQVAPVGPTIEIIEPPVLITRGPGEILTSPDGSLDLIGRVSPVDSLLSFAINGQRQSVNDAGVFNYRTNQVSGSIELTAVDDSGERASVTFSITQRNKSMASIAVANTSSAVANQYPDIEFGRYHAIIIGNNQYEELSDLRTPEADAQKIDELLREQYGFTTQLLINATKLDILTALNSAKEMLTEKDNLIVYYAGHGQLEPNGDRGYWLPVDATVDSTDQWISNSVVTNYLDSISAKQIMVVADSCFSGTLTKASIPRMQKSIPEALRKKWLTLMAKRKVRTVLSSGGVKPVYDGMAQHSLFATAFIEQLSTNQGILEGHRLYSDIREDVQTSAFELGVDQVPQYAAIKYAGHEVGEFLFVSQ